ncbi:retrovirus-related pol polyprotein from transposon TNT 1-94 [Tanacetum coccineum]|uniref:Retrovirus-related pol polyprotein from transposon TNT 1-94 n=1 Tax=Tanacetum coccineum TaxID=301880 RepID=A0ABQ5FR14_9ASTR
MIKAKEKHIVSQKLFRKFQRKAEFASHGLVWSNAGCKHKWEEIYSGDCTEFLNKTLHAYFKEEGIEHQTSTPRTPEQNGVVERRNRTLVEAARTMLSASKLPLSFWAEAVCTTVMLIHRKDQYQIDSLKEQGVSHQLYTREQQIHNVQN